MTDVQLSAAVRGDAMNENPRDLLDAWRRELDQHTRLLTDLKAGARHGGETSGGLSGEDTTVAIARLETVIPELEELLERWSL